MKTSVQLAGLVILAAFITFSEASCPDEYSPWFNGHCFRLLNGTRSKDARKTCEDDDAVLTSIHSAEENAWMASLIGAGNKAWIGLSCDDLGQHSHWVDGSRQDYQGPKGEVNKCNPYDDYAIDSQGNWVGLDSYTLLYGICKLRRTTNIKCGDFDEIPGSSTCVRLFDGYGTNYAAAEKTCIGLGSHLVSIHDDVTNQFIGNKAVENGNYNAVLIGLRANVSQGDLYWNDGSDVDFTNYRQGFPSDLFGGCTALEPVVGEPPEWRSDHCNTNYFPFACGHTAVDHPTQAPPVCPTNKFFNESGEIFSPSYPAGFPVGLSCEYILSVGQKETVQLTFVDFESNACCDSLAIYDGDTLRYTVSGKDQLNGASYNFNSSKIRLVWTAGNALGVRGFHAKFRGVA